MLSQRWPRDARYISRSWAVAEIWPFEIIQDGVGHHLGLVRTGNSALRSAVPENPTLEPNMKWIGSPVAEIWPFAYVGAYGTPILGEWEVVAGQRFHQSKERWWFPRLSIVTVVLLVTIRPQFAIKYLRRSNQQGWVTLGQNFRMFPWSRPLMFGSAESEHPRLTNGKIISDEQSTNVTDGQTDGQTTCDRKTALCTRVHHAVKTVDGDWWLLHKRDYKIVLSFIILCTVFLRRTTQKAVHCFF